MDRGDFVETTAASETLRQPGKKGPARTELRVADTDARAVADLVDLVEQVEDVEADFRSLEKAGGDRLNEAEVHLLIAWQAVAVWNCAIGHAARVGGPQTAAGNQVDGKPGSGRRPLILDTGRV